MKLHWKEYFTKSSGVDSNEVAKYRAYMVPLEQGSRWDKFSQAKINLRFAGTKW